MILSATNSHPGPLSAAAQAMSYMVPSVQPMLGLAASPLKADGHLAVQLDATLDAIKARSGSKQTAISYDRQSGM